VILDDIVAHKREEIAAREARTCLAEVQRHARAAGAPRPVSFSAPMSIIAEVKRRSPSAGEIAGEIDPVQQARSYQHGGAAAISVLADDRFFGGSLDDLRAVREAVDIPVLCKDFFLTSYQVFEARACGADLILLILATLDDSTFRSLLALVQELGMTPLAEVHNQHELARAIAADSPVIGINNRDLSDFTVDLLTTEYLAPLVPDGVVVVSESGISTRADIERVQRAGAQVALVGEALMRSGDPVRTIGELLT
jgi:indole-3-glycerol phosphate synthase